MFLLPIPLVDHTQASHAQGSAVFANRDEIRDGIMDTTIIIQVNGGADVPFPAKPIGGIVVVCGIQTEVADRMSWLMVMNL